MKKLSLVLLVICALSVIVCSTAFGGAGNVWILNHEAEWVGDGKYWCDYSWRVHIKNNSHADVRLQVTMEVQDRSAFALHKSREIAVIRARSQEWVTGTGRLARELAEKASKSTASIARY